MGWNTLEPDADHPVLQGVNPTDRFYFVHSYCVIADDTSNMLTSTTYGLRFNSGIARGNIIGFQFHPEKSHASGLALLKNFARL
jgi:glutamine amidotransferase